MRMMKQLWMFFASGVLLMLTLVACDGKEGEGRYYFLLPTVGGMYLSRYDGRFLLLDRKGRFLYYVEWDRYEDFLER